MSNSDQFDPLYNVLGLGLYGLGTGIVVNYPQTQPVGRIGAEGVIRHLDQRNR